MENRENPQNSKTSTPTEHLDTASNSHLARKTSRSGTIWGKFSKVFAKKKPKPKAQSKTNSVILPQQLTPIAQSKNGYRARFAEQVLAYAKVEKLAMLVGLPDWIDENVTITLELNLLSCSSPGRYQEPKPLVCTSETDSQTVFTGSLKVTNKGNVLNIMSMPLYLVDSKEAVNSQRLEHETILKASDDVPYAKKGPDSGIYEVQVSVIFTRLHSVEVPRNLNGASSESDKYEDTLAMAIRKEMDALIDHTSHDQAANDGESQSAVNADIQSEDSGNDLNNCRMRGSGVILTSTPDCDQLSLCNMSTQINSPWDDKNFDNYYVPPWGSVPTQYLLTYEDTKSAAAFGHCDMFSYRNCRDETGASTSQCQKCIVNHMSTQYSGNDEGPSVPCCKIVITAEVSTQYSSSCLMQDKEVEVQDSLCNMRLSVPSGKDSGSWSSLSYALGDLNRQQNILCQPKDSNLSSDITAWPSSSTTTNIGDSSTLPSIVSDESVSLQDRRHSQGFSVKSLDSTIQQRSWSPMTRTSKISISKVPKEYPPFPSATSNFEGKPESLLNEELCLTSKIANVNPLGEFARCEVVSNLEVHIANDPFRDSEQKYQSYYEDNDRFYETHRENVRRYFDDATSPKQQVEVHLGGDSSRSDCDTKMGEFKVCLTKMGDILATSSNSKDIEKSTDDQLLSKERLQTYEKAENGIQNIIKELLKESGDIKESALLRGAKEECDPPVVLDYVKTKPDYEKLCAVMIDEMGKYSTTVKEDASVMIGDVLNEIIDKSAEIANSRIEDRAYLNDETKASTPRLTYFPHSTFTDSKVPKTSYCFGEVACNTCITISSTPSTHSKQIANDSSGEQAKIECFLAEDVQCHETLARAPPEEEKFQASVSLNSMTAEFENSKDLPTDHTIMCKETDEEVFIQNIDLITSDWTTQTECNLSSEQEISSTVPDHQPSTSSGKEQLPTSCIVLQQKPATHNIQQTITGKLCSSSGSLTNEKILEEPGNESPDADDESDNISPNLNLPKSRYKSKQDLNTPQEIADIEKNLQENDTCVRKGEVLFDSQKLPD
uniref:Uncharacterized protein n=1 Tax=Photinus pyralis TaxID=7054 RepID=A0A1Y1M3P9_PHOPY